jgi:hypothetical protein
MTTAVDDGSGGRRQQSMAAADDAGKTVADDGTVSCLHGRGGQRQWTMVVMGVGGSIDLFHLFFTLLLLALLYFIVGKAREICKHFQELSTKSSRKSCLSCYRTCSSLKKVYSLSFIEIQRIEVFG